MSGRDWDKMSCYVALAIVLWAIVKVVNHFTGQGC